MSCNQRQKGARGERELAEWLRNRGVSARRGQQYSGSPDSPDVVTELDDMIHIECKRTERLSLYEAMEQAEEDSGENQYPVVMHKRNRKYWLAVMDARDWLTLVIKARAYDVLKRSSDHDATS